MGNGVAKAGQYCFSNGTTGDISLRHDDMVVKGLGHSFCYIKADQPPISGADIYQPKETTKFFSISGASVSANTSSSSSSSTTTSSTEVSCPYSSSFDEASAFESSDSFASVPLQPVPRRSGQLQSVSGSTERGFLSGPIERGFLSDAIEGGFVSAPIDRDMHSSLEKEKEKENSTRKLQKSFSLVGETEVKNKKRNMIKILKRAISDTISRRKRSLMADGTGTKDPVELRNGENLDGKSCSLSSEMGLKNEVDKYGVFPMQSQNLQWAQGKAGEDRVHIVISEEHGWIFVGIYDGFNGADAPDFLLYNLYTNVNEELKSLLWNDGFDYPLSESEKTEESSRNENHKFGGGYKIMDTNQSSKIKQGKNSRHRRDQSRGSNSDWFNHFDVLKALSRALKKTEEKFFETADKMAQEKPELALMGSCVLVMLMKGVDVYLMNVGDSRAVLAQKKTDTDLRLGKGNKDLERISEERLRDFRVLNGEEIYRLSSFNSIQLTMDHSTYVHKEVQRIKQEHPDDPCAVTNDRVKGYLKVTRAFGVGFLKQPKWNDLLLEMFRIVYVGKSPYITCFPSLYHHRLGSRDRFLILSSDGLYQYFTNEEAVSEVEFFIGSFPEGDPAQHLIEQVLFRAAKRAGMEFHELLDIPQGDRRRYHDDVSVIIFSLEGRLWRSSL